MAESVAQAAGVVEAGESDASEWRRSRLCSPFNEAHAVSLCEREPKFAWFRRGEPWACQRGGCDAYTITDVRTRRAATPRDASDSSH